MELSLRRATIADAEALVDIYLSAFEDDLISQRVFPRSSASSRAFWLDMLREEMCEESAHFLVVTTSAGAISRKGSEGGDQEEREEEEEEATIVAFAKWNPPRYYPPSALALPAQWPDASDVALATAFFGALTQTRLALVGDGAEDRDRVWYLELIATRPAWQRKGAAGQLIRWGLERADREARRCYLEASPGGKPVYERYGFRERERLVVDVSGEEDFVEVFMVRDVLGKEEEEERR
ncbi:GNAT family protein [Phlyctema vagabunda]|uniref:GNAT family protein n=1 Tax=Phlyctema vagabunda TaxID=108571 RepID=A0ABR4PQT3_9HELO